MEITKAVLPVAGFGTRFLPATKVQAKEMLPLWNKPIIQYLVEELADAGIKEIIFVISKEKTVLKKYFSPLPKLEKQLELLGKKEELKITRSMNNMAKYRYVIQEKQLGDGHAVLCAEKFINSNDSFVVLFGDEIIDYKISGAKQLVSAYKKTKGTVLGLQKICPSDCSKYGMVSPSMLKNGVYEIKMLKEKPKIWKKSNLATIGKYVCNKNIFTSLRKADKKGDKELRLIHGFQYMLEMGEKIHGINIKGERYDTGSPVGFLKANLHFAVKDKNIRESMGKNFKKYLKQL